MSAEIVCNNEDVRMQFNKTVMCKFYVAGKCHKGGQCGFAHDMRELRSAPDLTKTSLCKAWAAGKCAVGSDKCLFAHGTRELRVTPMFENRVYRRPRAPTGSSKGSSGDVKATSTNVPDAAIVENDVRCAWTTVPSFCDTDEGNSKKTMMDELWVGETISLVEMSQWLMYGDPSMCSLQSPEFSEALERVLIDAMPSEYED